MALRAVAAPWLCTRLRGLMTVPVYCKTVAASSGPELEFKVREVVPGREQPGYSGRQLVMLNAAGRRRSKDEIANPRITPTTAEVLFITEIR